MSDLSTELEPTVEAEAAIRPRHGIVAWLRSAPISDPVDRRNAPMVQILMLLLGILPPLLWLYRIIAVSLPWRPGELREMLVSMVVSAIALLGVFLVRRGRLQWATRQMLAVIAAAFLVTYASHGFAAGAYERPLLIVWLLLSGLVTGRRALWLMYATVLVAFALGTIVDIRAATAAVDTPMNLAMAMLIEAIMLLMITVVLDRSITALRESLREANRRGDALTVGNQRLQAEMLRRQETEQQLIHAQKVEAVGRLASGVAHDFNHLLGLMLGYAAKGQRSDNNDELRKALIGVEAAARRASAVTRKLLDFSRFDASHTERFDVVAAVRDLQPLLRQLFDPGTRIDYELPDEPIFIDFDRSQLDLVILNIAGNANQAMPEGGRFNLSLRKQPLLGQIELSLCDTGVGMADTVQRRLFEPFFTTRVVGQGTGLGLSVANTLVRARDGTISVQSALGRGSTFRVSLPVSTRDV